VETARNSENSTKNHPPEITMNNLRPASFLLLQLLLLSNTCSAERATENENPLARMILDRFAPSSKNVGFLRKLADEASTPMKEAFGPGSDWSCSAESNLATDFDSCTLSEASKTLAGGCSWCPLGSITGICLGASQASVINGLENDHLLHLKCYSDSEEVIDEAATAFWDEAMECIPHHKDTCGGDHGDGDHDCTYCTVGEPAMGLCLSKSLWDNMVVAQQLEYFEADVSTSNFISLEQVIKCVEEPIEDEEEDEGIWNNPCDGTLIDSDVAEAECFTNEGCAVAPNIFPGLLGSKSGKRCVSVVQERATAWAMEILEDMGWKKEMGAYEW